MSRRSLLRMHYWDTYFYSQVVHNLLSKPGDFLRHLEEFFGDQNYRGFIRPYPKVTVLHQFIEWAFLAMLDETVDDVMEDSIVHDASYQPLVTMALDHHGIEHVRIRPWLKARGISDEDLNEDAIHDYHADLRDTGPLEQLIEQVSEEVFFLLFLNRGLLRRLHEEIADRIRDLDPSDLPPDEAALFRRTGILERVRPPEWARRAVFHRDRGMCSFCHCDLSGLVAIGSEDRFDHIVPLAVGGTNDVTNLQLLCANCNGRKGARSTVAGTEYERWY